MPEILNIAVIGGGIGGLATAIALLQRGFKVQVYERAQALRPIGAGLTLTPNGLHSLEAMRPGIVAALKQAGSELHTLTLKRSTGETITSKSMPIAQQFGQPMLNIQWSRLQSILAAALPPDVIHLSRRCTGIEQQDGHVTATFATGETIQPDLLIGADGVNSVVRQVLVGDGPPTYAGRMSWRAVLQYPHPLLTPNTSTLITAPDGKNFLLVDLGAGYTFWSAGALVAEATVCPGPGEVKARVLETFAGWTDPVEVIVQATPEIDIIERPICDRPPLKRWSQGRVTLLGDAAHPVVPSLGQGANMAFEDAFELAAFLASASDLETALHAYETSRIPRTDVIYSRSASQGDSSYKPDSAATLSAMIQPVQMNQEDFQSWVYSYQPVVSLTGGYSNRRDS